MTVDDEGTAGFSLRRWSRRKLDAARAAPRPEVAPAAAAPVEPRALPPVAPPAAATAAGDAAVLAAGALPPTDTLTFDSDFTAFLKPKVDEAVRRQALRTLFRDPRFNVMDGLDVYIDDYSIPDPISAEMVRGLVQSRDIFDPPQTRINAAGHVEDVPAAERIAPAARTGADAPAAIAATDSAASVPAVPASPPGVTPSEAPSPDADASAAAASATDVPVPAAPIPPDSPPRSDR